MLPADVILAAEKQGSGSLQQLLAFDPSQHPIAVQIGGGEPGAVARAAKLCEEAGYDEINLNLGCPSPKVASERFGACLMAEPDLAARLVSSMRAACADCPITAKHRIGVNSADSFEELIKFVAQLAAAGVRWFSIHARKAVIGSLTTAQNLDIPPLRYDWVQELVRIFPEMSFELNGGVKTLKEAFMHLSPVDTQGFQGEGRVGNPTDDRTSSGLAGVMIGRAAYHTPWILADADRQIFGVRNPGMSRKEVLDVYLHYAEAYLADHARSWTSSDQVLEEEAKLAAPLTGLFAGDLGGAEWSQELALLLEKRREERPLRPGYGFLRRAVVAAMYHVPASVLDERPPS